MHQEIADALDAVESDQDTRVAAFVEKRSAVFRGTPPRLKSRLHES